ncbi:MAG TPA: hypothetical protein VG455_00080 [Acidimicrobiales bacterium]|nr:hypothetical protein [Acidimicrobiales bacterium]
MAKGGREEDALGEATEELYGVDPADFVAARNALARRLRGDGARQLAAAVAKLRRPTPAAWAVNQLARRHPGSVGELARRGEELRAAQDRALAGAPAEELREASRARRESVAALTEVAVGVLAERGVGPDPHRNQIAATLEAASLDPEAAQAVQAGRLSNALEPPSGFGELDVGVVAAAHPSEPGAEPPDREARAAAEARREARELAAKARAREERAARLRRALEDAEDEVAARQRRLAEARRKRDEVAQELAEAEEEVARAEAAAEEATARLGELPD